MGEIHVQIITTLDGVIQANGGPNDLDRDFPYAGWERPFWDPVAAEQMHVDVEAGDALLLGRSTYDLFRSYWPGKTDDIGRAFDRAHKYVASRGTPELSWETSTQLTDVAAELPAVRDRHQQVHTWGSANLLQTLFAAGLVDQVNLWTCPVVIGQGKRLFPEGTTPTRYEPVEPATTYSRGLVLLRLRRLDGPPETAEPVEPRGTNGADG